MHSDAEVSALLAGARRLKPIDGLRPRTYTTLIGLLVCTGLRISEALRLRRDNFDDRGGALIIRQTKFHKSRLVPLSPSRLPLSSPTHKTVIDWRPLDVRITSS